MVGPAQKNYNDDIENIFIIITLIVYLSTFWHGFTKPGEILLSVLAIPWAGLSALSSLLGIAQASWKGEKKGETDAKRYLSCLSR